MATNKIEIGIYIDTRFWWIQNEYSVDSIRREIAEVTEAMNTEFFHLCIAALFIQCRQLSAIDPTSTTMQFGANDVLYNLRDFNSLAFGLPVHNKAFVKSNSFTLTHPEEMDTYFEGDILLPFDKNGLKSKSYRWSNGIVPYVVQGQFNGRQKSIIENAFREYHARTCIRFKPRTNEKDYIEIGSDDTGCWSSVGRMGGKQQINLQTPHCFRQVGTTIHELMHTVGFLHEQNRHERDNYIAINFNNIKSSSKGNFYKSTPSASHAYGIPYDYGSVMHYSSHAFSKNGKPTVVPKVPTQNAVKM